MLDLVYQNKRGEQMFDETKYSAKLALMDGNDLIDLEYYLVAELEVFTGDERVKIFRQVELIQEELLKRAESY